MVLFTFIYIYLVYVENSKRDRWVNFIFITFIFAFSLIIFSQLLVKMPTPKDFYFMFIVIFLFPIISTTFILVESRLLKFNIQNKKNVDILYEVLFLAVAIVIANYVFEYKGVDHYPSASYLSTLKDFNKENILKGFCIILTLIWVYLIYMYFRQVKRVNICNDSFFLIFISYYAYTLFPPSWLEEAIVIAFGYQDKRLLIFGFLFLCLFSILRANFQKIVSELKRIKIINLFSCKNWKKKEKLRKQKSFIGNIILLKAIFFPMLCLVIGFLVSFILYHKNLVITYETINGLVNFVNFGSHESFHYSAILDIERGFIPYIESRYQYGLGQLILSHKLMKLTEFSLLGFRLSHVILSFIGVSFLFAILFICFKWKLGFLYIFIFYFFWNESQPVMFHFFGWHYIHRWLGLVLCAIMYSNILWKFQWTKNKITQLIFAGLIIGFLGWMSQENLSLSIMSIFFMLMYAYLFKMVRLSDVCIIFITFSLMVIMVNFFLIGTFAGFSNIWDIFLLLSNNANYVASGLSNTDWYSTPSMPLYQYSLYYLTPYIILVCLLLTLRKKAINQDMFRFVSTLSAIIPLFAICMLRADISQLSGKLYTILPLFWMMLIINSSKIFNLEQKSYSKIMYNLTRFKVIPIFLVLVLLIVTPFSLSVDAVQKFIDSPNGIFKTWEVLKSVYKNKNRFAYQNSIEKRISYQTDLNNNKKLYSIVNPSGYYSIKSLTNFSQSVKEVIGDKPTFIDNSFDQGILHFLLATHTGSSYENAPSPAIVTKSDIIDWIKSIHQRKAACLITRKEKNLFLAYPDIHNKIMNALKSPPLKKIVYLKSQSLKNEETTKLGFWIYCH